MNHNGIDSMYINPCDADVDVTNLKIQFAAEGSGYLLSLGLALVAIERICEQVKKFERQMSNRD